MGKAVFQGKGVVFLENPNPRRGPGLVEQLLIEAEDSN